MTRSCAIAAAAYLAAFAGGTVAFNPGVFDPQLTTAQRGVPIKVEDDTIGAIGAGGAPGGDKDEACSNAGIAKIGDRLI
jgi:uncharacterized protein GlcG (DUF336 family)